MASNTVFIYEPEILLNGKYFAKILEYVNIKDIFSTICLLSKYHLNYIKNAENKRLFERLITNQLGCIFQLSASFRNLYYNPITNPYNIIQAFFTDFGIIHQIAFPIHHQKVMKACSKWRKIHDSINWDEAKIIIDEEHEIFENPFQQQYNAINYNKTPFDFRILTQLRNSTLLIHWMKFVISQKHINTKYRGLEHIFYNKDILGKLQCDVKSFVITSINNCEKTGGGYRACSFIIRNIAGWPSKEFEKVISFMIDESHCRRPRVYEICTQFIDAFLRNKEIGCENYKIFLEKCSNHPYQQAIKSRIGQIIELEQGIVLFDKIIETVYGPCSEDDHELEINVINAVRNDQYVRNIFGTMGEFLMEKSRDEDIRKLLEEIPHFLCHHMIPLYDLFCELLGFDLSACVNVFNMFLPC